MAFHNIRLPDGIGRGFSGGPRFQTAVVKLLSGYESRNANRAKARASYNASYPFDLDQWQTITAFFYARGGKANSFRFKDWGDFKLGDTFTDTYQEIGVGDGVETDFQIYKRYSSGGIDYDRDLTKIVSNTTRVWVDAVEAVGGWSVNLLSGILSFSVAPGGSPAPSIGVLCEFDVPVRFDTDELNVNMTTQYVANVPAVPLIEVFGE